MNAYFANLRPVERRMVVGTGVVFFIVLNFWFVFPHFSDWSHVQDRMFEAQRKLGNYEREIGQIGTYSNLVHSLESEGLEVPPEDQATHFSTAINSQAGQSRVEVQQVSRIQSRTNQFFLEMMQSLNVQSGESQLVDFLYHLGAGNSLIRVRGLSVHTDGPRMKLLSGVTLVASYQKKLTTKAAPAAGQPGGTRPAATPARSGPPAPVVPAAANVKSNAKKP